MDGASEGQATHRRTGLWHSPKGQPSKTSSIAVGEIRTINFGAIRTRKLWDGSCLALESYSCMASRSPLWWPQALGNGAALARRFVEAGYATAILSRHRSTFTPIEGELAKWIT
jgi:hypothetical protein